MLNRNPQNSGNKYRFPKKKYNEDIRAFVANNVASLKKGSYILDAGCDTGYLSGQLVDTYKIIGVDSNADSIDKCRTSYPEGEYRVADLRRLPFQDNFFDGIILNMVIEHFNDTDALLKELNRVLKAGGVMVVTTPNYANILWVLIENVWFRLFERGFKPYSREVHPSKFNSLTLQRCCSQHFKSVEGNKITYGFTLTAVVSK